MDTVRYGKLGTLLRKGLWADNFISSKIKSLLDLVTSILFGGVSRDPRDRSRLHMQAHARRIDQSSQGLLPRFHHLAAGLHSVVFILARGRRRGIGVIRFYSTGAYNASNLTPIQAVARPYPNTRPGAIRLYPSRPPTLSRSSLQRIKPHIPQHTHLVRVQSSNTPFPQPKHFLWHQCTCSFHCRRP